MSFKPPTKTEARQALLTLRGYNYFSADLAGAAYKRVTAAFDTIEGLLFPPSGKTRPTRSRTKR